MFTAVILIIILPRCFPGVLESVLERTIWYETDPQKYISKTECEEGDKWTELPVLPSPNFPITFSGSFWQSGSDMTNTRSKSLSANEMNDKRMCAIPLPKPQVGKNVFFSVVTDLDFGSERGERGF
jgi:hypothetical protein